MQEYFIVNKKNTYHGKIDINVKDMGLLYGYSLFETMLIKKAEPVFLKQHLKRLISSSAELGMGVCDGHNELMSLCRKAVILSGIKDGLLRLTVTAGNGSCDDGNAIVFVKEGVPYKEEHYSKGFKLITLDFPRNEKSPIVRHKTANYLENFLGRQEANRRGCDEGLFINTQGMVAEGTVSNIFIVNKGKLITPPAEAGLLPGIVRRWVIEYTKELGLTCIEANFTRFDLLQTKECFVTNSLMGIMPVTKVDSAIIGTGLPGGVTRQIMKFYKFFIENQ
ncbi:aminotransferase class IV [Desulfoscipio gibsoniae]|uniref:Branched-chain amino acid aminotransferase/4-amino-4-deoxychorismate lyase n=1 Tax=Desulfoscipio gibsoniae DSM 7213 TaxID=767817 RepID=R4KEU5_9FIRM|nr:aminotransferase class IV [Desulfoscipio gibsoniae]AGL01718.1 branched-chain amino acid aminotransferase/4-amino-4-deoxychorismate lyase [Desulfoscipio gibsoniae DSM 7213]